jgi:DNA helicase-2/ATP-dependent DNA helicase PcrA
MPQPDLLSDLTPAQREAVTHMEGPLLILAGPGSGKTRVITRRIAYLLEQGVQPARILAVTFTNKAAGEMRQRVWQLLPESRKVDPSGVEIPPHKFIRISTFHSFGATLLRQYGDRFGLDRNFTIYDQTERTRVVKMALEDAGVDNARFTPETIQGAISKAKNELLSPERYAQRTLDFFGQVVARVYPVYEKRMRECNALDFDDLLYWPAMGLQHDQEWRADLDARFRFILIDEYQDTNRAQYVLARYLSMDNPNLCVVGDPDQSIYKFRGSDIKNILDFERDFPTARVLTLSQNYRSTKSILRAASHLIAHNRQRKPKDLVTDNPQGQPVTLLTYETGTDEAEGTAIRIRKAVEAKGRSYRDFAIFVRMNALTRALEAAFVKHRVPFQIVKGLAFFDRKENRDVLAYLRLLVNPRDDLSFLRCVNEPARGVGKASLDYLRQYAEPREMSLLEAAGEVKNVAKIKGKAAKGLAEFAAMMRDLRGVIEGRPDEVIRAVLDRSGYRMMLKDSRDEEDQERLANVEELVTAAKQFAEEDPSRTIADFLENITLASDVDGWDERQDCVSVMTLHAAKGLEFPVVYIAAVEQGILPHERSLSKDDQVEEERRLAFVGITRAKEECYLTHARMREFRGSALYAIPSLFLEELPQDAVEEIDLSTSAAGRQQAMDAWRTGGRAAEQGWKEAGVRPAPAKKAEPSPPAAPDNGDGLAVGVFVHHPQFGAGRVTEVSGYGALRRVKVRFAVGGEKTLVVQHAKLTVLRKG